MASLVCRARLAYAAQCPFFAYRFEGFGIRAPSIGILHPHDVVEALMEALRLLLQHCQYHRPEMAIHSRLHCLNQLLLSDACSLERATPT